MNTEEAEREREKKKEKKEKEVECLLLSALRTTFNLEIGRWALFQAFFIHLGSQNHHQ